MEELAKDEGDLALDDSMLSDDEKKMVEEFSEQINVRDSAHILQYGAGTQKKMADFSDAALANVRTQDLGEVGDLIVNVVGELKGFDAEEEKGFFGFFRKQANKLEVMKSRYAKAEVNVEKIGDALQQHQVRLLKDSAMLDKMYEQNLAYFKELTHVHSGGQEEAPGGTGRQAQGAGSHGAGHRPCRGRSGGKRPGGQVQPVREEDLRSGADPHHRHADGASDPSRCRTTTITLVEKIQTTHR